MHNRCDTLENIAFYSACTCIVHLGRNLLFAKNPYLLDTYNKMSQKDNLQFCSYVRCRHISRQSSSSTSREDCSRLSDLVPCDPLALNIPKLDMSKQPKQSDFIAHLIPHSCWYEVDPFCQIEESVPPRYSGPQHT